MMRIRRRTGAVSAGACVCRGLSCLASAFPAKMGPPGALLAGWGEMKRLCGCQDAHFPAQCPGLGIVCLQRPLWWTEGELLMGFGVRT